MGSPKPWPTPWPEPTRPGRDEPDWPSELPGDPGPREQPDTPVRLPEDVYAQPCSSVTWGVTHPCNLRCTHCYDVVGFDRVDLTTSEALTVIDRLVAVGITFIAFSGGEPLLRKDLFKLLQYCSDANISFSIRSNGTRISPTTAQRLAELGTTVVGISLDGATQATHDQVRGAGAFRAALSGIKALVASGVRVNIEYVLSRRNVDECLLAVALAESLHVNELNFSAIQPQGRARELSTDLLDYELWRNVTARLHRASKRAGIPVSPSCALLGECVACIEPNVTCDGWVTPCYLSSHKLFNLLSTPPNEVRERLRKARPSYLDVCGRRSFLAPGTDGVPPKQLIQISGLKADISY